MSISKIFDISKRSLLSHQTAIDTTSKNITNVNNEGYKKRRIDLSNLALGFNTVSGDGITRIRQRFAESQLWKEHQNLSKYQTDEMLMTNVEDIYGEPEGSGLANVMSEFWNAWNDLANDPESQSYRTVVRSRGILLARTFNRIHQSFKTLQQDVSNDIQEKVLQINQYISQIAKINNQIGIRASNDLLDERDVLITNLSRLLNIEIRENQDKNVTISTGGQILVTGTTVNSIAVSTESVEGNLSTRLFIEGSDRQLDITTGELGSLVSMQNTYIPDQIEKINLLAKTVTERVNALHQSGYNLDGTTGINFFKSGVTQADEMEISTEIDSDPTLIATASVPGEPGDGSIAQALFDLQSDTVINQQSFSNFYNMVVSQVGNDVKEASFLKSSEEKLVQSLQNQRDSVTGVSLDEEMTKLVEYERAYQAAARMIASADEMIQTILNLV